MAALFWMIVLGFSGAVWSMTLVGFLLSRRNQNRGWRVAGALPFALVTTVGVLSAASFGWTMVSHDNPRTIWNEEFGFAPTADVRALNSSYFSFGDSATTYLQFRCSSATIKRIVKKKKLVFVARKNHDSVLPATSGSEDSNVPSWWKPTNSAHLQMWHKDSHQYFAGERTYLDFNTKTGWAHYSFEGID